MKPPSRLAAGARLSHFDAWRLAGRRRNEVLIIDPELPPDYVDAFAIAWRDAGLRAPTTPSIHARATCALPDCPKGAFVQVKTIEGPYPLCFGHFEAVKKAVATLA